MAECTSDSIQCCPFLSQRVHLPQLQRVYPAHFARWVSILPFFFSARFPWSCSCSSVLFLQTFYSGEKSSVQSSLITDRQLAREKVHMEQWQCWSCLKRASCHIFAFSTLLDLLVPLVTFLNSEYIQKFKNILHCSGRETVVVIMCATSAPLEANRGFTLKIARHRRWELYEGCCKGLSNGWHKPPNCWNQARSHTPCLYQSDVDLWQPGKNHVATHNQKHNLGTFNMAAWWLCSSILKGTLKPVACPESDMNPGISRGEQRKSQSCHSRVPSTVAAKGIVRNDKSFSFRLRYLKLKELWRWNKCFCPSISGEHDETSLASVTVEHSLLIKGITCGLWVLVQRSHYESQLHWQLCLKNPEGCLFSVLCCTMPCLASIYPFRNYA